MTTPLSSFPAAATTLGTSARDRLSPLPTLPVEAVLPALLHDLAHTSNAVLCAPPGAGKTTRIPLALLHAP